LLDYDYHKQIIKKEMSTDIVTGIPKEYYNGKGDRVITLTHCSDGICRVVVRDLTESPPLCGKDDDNKDGKCKYWTKYVLKKDESYTENYPNWSKYDTDDGIYIAIDNKTDSGVIVWKETELQKGMEVKIFSINDYRLLSHPPPIKKKGDDGQCVIS
jgi:hypothetical protein